MTYSSTIIAVAAVLGTSAMPVIIYGTRYRHRRRAEKLRRRGYKDHNRGRARLAAEAASRSSTADGTAGR